MVGPIERARHLVREVADFPTPGIAFKDLAPALGDAGALGALVAGLADPWKSRGITKVVGIEARGFVLAAPVAIRLGAGFVPVRKPGKLPGVLDGEDYSLEYGAGRLEIQADSVDSRDRVLVVDDVLATGGTAAAAVRILERRGAAVVALAFAIELASLAGRERLDGRAILSLITY